MVPWYTGKPSHGALVKWCHGALVKWCHETLVKWCHGTLVLAVYMVNEAEELRAATKPSKDKQAEVDKELKLAKAQY